MQKYSVGSHDYDLHVTCGYTVYPKAINVPICVWEKCCVIANEEARLIFNGGAPSHHTDTEDAGDGKRSQAELDHNLSLRPKVVQQLCSRIKAYLNKHYPNHTPRDFVILRSDKGCEDQPAHMDYTPSDTKHVTNDEEMPLACVLCLEEGTMFDVWPWAFGPDFWSSPFTRYPNLRLALNVGDLLVFRGDLVHAGAGYNHDNIRLHCYMDHKSTKRTHNVTFYLDQDSRILPRKKVKI